MYSWWNCFWMFMINWSIDCWLFLSLVNAGRGIGWMLLVIWISLGLIRMLIWYWCLRVNGGIVIMLLMCLIKISCMIDLCMSNWWVMSFMIGAVWSIILMKCGKY